NWRRELPRRMDDTHAKSLFEQLIQDAVTVLPSRQSGEVTVHRWLESTDNDIWTLHSSLDLPNRITLDDLQILFPSLDSNTLSRTPTLSLIAGDNSIDWPLHRLTGQRAYRVSMVRLDLSGEVATVFHQSCLRDQQGGHHNGRTRSGEALDTDLPWLFDEREDKSPSWIRQGSGGVRTESAIVAVPADWTVVAHDMPGSSIELIALLESPERDLYRLYGHAKVVDTSGHKWTIRSAQADADEDDYHWDGNRYWIESIQPSLVFRGSPSPSLRNGDCCIDLRDLDWQPNAPDNRWGPVTASYIKDGEIRHRAKLLLLPERAEVSIIPRGPEGGSIRLEGWEVESLRLVQNAHSEETYVTMNAHRQGSDMVIDLGVSPHVSQHLIPHSVVLGLAWPGHPEETRILFRYPAKGARAFDASGRVLSSESWLSLANLLGVRLVAVGVTGPLRLMLEVQRPHEILAQGIANDYTIKSIEGPGYIEVRLQDHIETIERLLATEDLLDAWVKCVLLDRNQTPLLTLRLSRYTASLDRFPTQVALKPSSLDILEESELSTIHLFALRLESPADEPIELHPSCSEGVLTGVWDFDPTVQEVGSWLIYSSPGSPVVLRPLLYSHEGGGDYPENSYAHVIGLSDRTQRDLGLDILIERMSCNFLDPAWNELERLISHLNHLPLVSLDFCRRLALNPRGMTALALRLGDLPPDFVLRFPNELPFDWVLVPYRAWNQAAEQLLTQCDQWFGTTISHGEYQKHLENSFQHLCERYPALESLLLILRCKILQEFDQDPHFRIMLSPEGEAIFQDQLFSGENSEVQRLLREHANDNHWPTNPDITHLIQQAHKSDLPGVGQLRCEYLDFQNSLINLPILLALRCIYDPGDHAFDGPQRIHAIRSFRAFDPDWFDAAFHCTIARCLSRGLFDS
ncbi:MAG: STY4851/ECs_5259 family protein, partial [Candidatus Thiodiazotropha sp.]